MPSVQDIVSAATGFGVDQGLATIAAEMICEREVVMLGFSGKLASGKDSVAAGVVASVGLEPAIHFSFAKPLKDEVDLAIGLAKSGRLSYLRDELRVQSAEVCRTFEDLLVDALTEDPDATARSRTAGMRRVLQFWGTEVRRAERDDYWVSKAVDTALRHASEGRSIYYTDGRFPNEIAGSQQIGFLVVRLEVSPEVQAQRLEARDGLAPDPVSLLHPSEIALDHFKGFDLITRNEGPFDQTVGFVSDWVRSQTHR